MSTIVVLFTAIHLQNYHEIKNRHKHPITINHKEGVMKKLIQMLGIATVFVFATFAMNNVATADGCTISNTGPDSKNKCTSVETKTCTLNNDNTVTVSGESTQVSVSGNGSVTGNTSGGSAMTGSATNKNGTTINVSIKNGQCIAVVTKTKEVTPGKGEVTPGKGEVTPTGGQGAVAPQQVSPTTLPNTGSDTMAGALTLFASIAGFGAVISSIGVSSYRYLRR